MNGTTSVTVNIHMRDDGPGPQVHDLTGSGDPLVSIDLTARPATVAILVSSAVQADRLIAALTVAKELLTGGEAQS